MASRAELLAAHVGGGAGDQHGVDLALAQMPLDVGGALDEGAVALLVDLAVLRFDVELVPILVAVLAQLHRIVAALHPLRQQQPVVVIGPTLPCFVGRVADPHHMPAAPPQVPRHAVDRRHDLARERYLALVALLHEIILHVDDKHRGALRIERIERMRLAAPHHDALGDGFGNRDLVHGMLPVSWPSRPGEIVGRIIFGRDGLVPAGSAISVERLRGATGTSVCGAVGISGSIAAAPHRVDRGKRFRRHARRLHEACLRKP